MKFSVYDVRPIVVLDVVQKFWAKQSVERDNLIKLLQAGPCDIFIPFFAFCWREPFSGNEPRR